MAVNCKTMDREDVFRIMEQLLAGIPDGARLSYQLPGMGGNAASRTIRLKAGDRLKKCRNVTQKDGIPCAQRCGKRTMPNSDDRHLISKTRTSAIN